MGGRWQSSCINNTAGWLAQSLCGSVLSALHPAFAEGTFVPHGARGDEDADSGKGNTSGKGCEVPAHLHCSGSFLGAKEQVQGALQPFLTWFWPEEHQEATLCTGESGSGVGGLLRSCGFCPCLVPPAPPVCPSLSKRCQPFLPKLLFPHASVVEGAVSSFEVLTSTRRFGERFKSSVVDKYEMDSCTGRGFSFPQKPTWVVGHSVG